jgi:hypothetical protein
MKKDLLNTVIRQVKQDIINIQAGEVDSYLRFENNGMDCFSLCNSGGYSIIYDNTNDRLIVAWALRLSINFAFQVNKGSWGNGYYFNNNGGNDIIDRYEIDNVVSLWLDKAFELNEVYANPL